jgi:thiamine pyrophosphokinase
MTNKTQKTILIIANGESPSRKILLKLLRESDCIIAADGGCNICYEFNIYPDYIVGDLDSAKENVLNYFNDAEVIYLSDQYTHDLAKAIDFAVTLNPKLITAVSVTGKRLDHTLSNLVFLQSAKYTIPIIFYDNYGRLSIIEGQHQLDVPASTTISIFSFQPVYGLSLDGFKYILHNQDFPAGFNGLSNVTTQEGARILIDKGSLFLYIIHENITT